MQNNYTYSLTAPIGQNFASDLTPEEMLRLGVFGGKYMNDCKKEFPLSWFENGKFSPDKKDIELNYFLSMHHNHYPNGKRRDGFSTYYNFFCNSYIESCMF